MISSILSILLLLAGSANHAQVSNCPFYCTYGGYIRLCLLFTHLMLYQSCMKLLLMQTKLCPLLLLHIKSIKLVKHTGFDCI